MAVSRQFSTEVAAPFPAHRTATLVTAASDATSRDRAIAALHLYVARAAIEEIEHGPDGQPS